MEQSIFLIPKEYHDLVDVLLTDLKIQYEIAGFPNGKVVLHQYAYSSLSEMKPEIITPKEKTPKMKPEIVEKPKAKQPQKTEKEARDEHQEMIDFAKKLGCEDISEAINKLGNGRAFRKEFLKDKKKKKS